MPNKPKSFKMRSGAKLFRQPEQRGNSHQRGYTHVWERIRAAYLRDNPLCQDCREQGRLTPATEAHHLERHKGKLEKVLTGALRALCHACHSRRTARGE